MTDSDPSDYVCDNCGESTHGPLIGGECVRKCSNSVPVEALQELHSEMDKERNVDSTRDMTANQAILLCQRKVETLIEDYQ